MNDSTDATEVSIADIKIDGGTQPRTEIDQSVVAEYAEAMKAGNVFPPVVVFFDGVNRWLADGFHRYHAARKNKADKIRCDVRTGTQRDAQWFSFGANKDHGLRRGHGDVRRALEMILADAEWVKEPHGDIAKHVGCSQRYVEQIASEQCASSERSGDATRTVTRNGTTYSMNTAKIGGKKKVDDAALRSAEAVVAGGLGDAVGVAESLAAIRSGELWRGTHPTWDAYCRERVGRSALDVDAMIGDVGAVAGRLPVVHRYTPPDPEGCRTRYEQWWDLFASRVLLLDAIGQTVEQIATDTAMPVDDVRAILTPDPPARFTSEANGADLLTDAGQKLYRDAVAEAIAWHLGERYRRIIGSTDCATMNAAADVARMAKLHRQRTEHLIGSEGRLIEGMEAAGWPMQWCAAMLACATDDMRHALGIKRIEQPDGLLFRFTAKLELLAKVGAA